MVEGTPLLRVQTATSRGFESLPLRHIKKIIHLKQCHAHWDQCWVHIEAHMALLGPHHRALDTVGRFSSPAASSIPLGYYPPTVKKNDLADPTRGVPPLNGMGSLDAVGILSPTNDEHSSAYGTGVTGQGLCP